MRWSTKAVRSALGGTRWCDQVALCGEGRATPVQVAEVHARGAERALECGYGRESRFGRNLMA